MRKNFSSTHFYLLYQPSYCKKRVWMNVNYQHIAEDDSAFKELLYRRGKALEEKHLKDLGRYQKPEFLSVISLKAFQRQ